MAADTAQTSAALPRYKLEVGKKYSYADEAHFKYDNGGYDNEGTWDATVVAKNTDGTFRVLLRYVDVRTRKPTEGPERKNENTYYGCADFDDLGQFTERWNSFGVRVEPTKVFLRLPATAEEVASGWQSPKGIFDGKLHYRALQATDAEHPVYEIIEQRPESAIYGFEFKDTATFDVDRGIFQERDYTWKQTYGFNGEGSGSFKLTDVQQVDAETCRALAADAERYVQAKRNFDETTRQEGCNARIARRRGRCACGRQEHADHSRIPAAARQTGRVIRRRAQIPRRAVQRAASVDRPAGRSLHYD